MTETSNFLPRARIKILDSGCFRILTNGSVIRQKTPKPTFFLVMQESAKVLWQEL